MDKANGEVWIHCGLCGESIGNINLSCVKTVDGVKKRLCWQCCQKTDGAYE